PPRERLARRARHLRPRPHALRAVGPPPPALPGAVRGRCPLRPRPPPRGLRRARPERGRAVPGVLSAGQQPAGVERVNRFLLRPGDAGPLPVRPAAAARGGPPPPGVAPRADGARPPRRPGDGDDPVLPQGRRIERLPRRARRRNAPRAPPGEPVVAD